MAMIRLNHSRSRNMNRASVSVAIVVTLTVLLAGCDDLLVKTPLGQETSESFFTTETHAIQATNATYNQLRQWNTHVFNWIAMTDIVSDDATKGSTPADAPQLLEIDNLNFDPGAGPFVEVWTGFYQGIYRANLAINNIPDIDMDIGLQNRLVGENKFLRAYFYSFLARSFGGVPLITEPLSPGEFEQARADVEEVYALIVQDLTDAIDALPYKSQYAGADMGRATRGAAQALLAKVQLHRQNYQEAERLARDVIESGEYDLLPDYAEIFTPQGENSSESVWEVQTVAIEEGGGGTQYSQVQGVRGSPNLGWGFNQPSDQLEAAFEPGDQRQAATILYPWELLPDNSGLFVYANAQISNQRYNQKAFASPSEPGGIDNGGSNIRRIRYADVLLIAAEAAYQNGNIGDAQFFLNLIRERARDGRSATIGIVPETLASFMVEHLDLDPASPGVMVRWAHAEGPAAAAGVTSPEFGFVAGNPAQRVDRLDVIRSVNGVVVNTAEAFFDAMATVTPGASVELELSTLTQTFANRQFATSREDWSAAATAETLLPDVTATGQPLLDAIWHERRVELAMEQHRWQDILRMDAVRPGIAHDLMSAHGKTFQPHQRLFPIPQSEIDLSGQLMTQNPGY